jgi:putative transposase
MARRKSTPLRTALSRMFPAALLRRLARETGTVRRRRRVDPVKLFWVVVLGIGRGERSFADLRRSYEKVTGEKISSSSFYNRFTPAFTRFLRELLSVGLEKLNRCAEGTGAVVGEIREILCVDSTIVRLHDALAAHWPACRTNHTLAAVKLHTVLNVARGRNGSSSPPSVFTTALSCAQASGSKGGCCSSIWATSATPCLLQSLDTAAFS